MGILSFFIENPIAGLILAILLFLAIGIHEAAHAYSAHWLGDSTPKSQGRLTLNPLKHLDPMGSLLIFLVGFGWGKAVEFNPYNLKNPRVDSALIAFAGPLSNILMAILSSILINKIVQFQQHLLNLHFPFFLFLVVNIFFVNKNLFTKKMFTESWDFLFFSRKVNLKKLIASCFRPEKRNGLLKRMSKVSTSFLGKL